MVEQVQPQRQWLGFLAVTDSDEGLSRHGIAVGCADIGFAGHCFAPLQKVQDRTVERRVFGHGALRCGQQIRSPQLSLRRAELFVFRLRVQPVAQGWANHLLKGGRQYSSASMIVITRLVTDGSAGSGEW
jgi:hypothetical protein